MSAAALKDRTLKLITASVIVHKTDGECDDIYNDGQVEAKMVGLAFCFVSAFVER